MHYSLPPPHTPLFTLLVHYSLPPTHTPLFTLQVHYSLSPVVDYLRAAVQTVVDLHCEDVPGDVLVFLMGQACVGMCREDGRGAAERTVRMRPHVPDRGGGGWGTHARLIDLFWEKLILFGHS